MRPERLSRLFDTALEQASRRRRDLMRHAREIEALIATDTTARATELEDAFIRIVSRSEQFGTIMEGYEKKRSDATDHYRAFQYEHGVRRPAEKPNMFMALYVIGTFITLEGGLAGFLMVADGHASSFVVGLGYGLLFAMLNVMTAVAGGYFGIRNMMWKVNAPYPETRDAKRRAWGRIALSASLATIALLLFVAMRTRVLGSHSGIFSFGEVGLLQTFNDGFSLALLVLGSLGAMFGFKEGYSGLSDPIPGYTAARHAVENLILVDVDAAAAGVEDSVMDIFEDAEELALDLIDGRDDLLNQRSQKIEAFYEARDTHHDDIDTDKQKFRSRLNAVNKSRSAIVRKGIDMLDLDVDALDGFRVPTMVFEQVEDLLGAPAAPSKTERLEYHLNNLRDAKDRALDDIALAVITFETNTPDLGPLD